MNEISRELVGGHGGFAERDGVERAVRDLTAAGLLRRQTEFVELTRAALRFSELMDR